MVVEVAAVAASVPSAGKTFAVEIWAPSLTFPWEQICDTWMHTMRQSTSFLQVPRLRGNQQND